MQNYSLASIVKVSLREIFFHILTAKEKIIESLKNMQKHFHKCITVNCFHSPNKSLIHQTLAMQSCFKPMLQTRNLFDLSKT